MGAKRKIIKNYMFGLIRQRSPNCRVGFPQKSLYGFPIDYLINDNMENKQNGCYNSLALFDP